MSNDIFYFKTVIIGNPIIIHVDYNNSQSVGDVRCLHMDIITVGEQKARINNNKIIFKISKLIQNSIHLVGIKLWWIINLICLCGFIFCCHSVVSKSIWAIQNIYMYIQIFITLTFNLESTFDQLNLERCKQSVRLLLKVKNLATLLMYRTYVTVHLWNNYYIKILVIWAVWLWYIL